MADTNERSKSKGNPIESFDDNGFADSQIEYPKLSSGSQNDLQKVPTVVETGKRIGDIVVESELKSVNFAPKRRGFRLVGKTGLAEFTDIRVGNDVVRIWGAGLRVKNGNGVFLAPPNSQARGSFTKTGGSTTLGSTTVSVTSTAASDKSNWDQILGNAAYLVSGPGIPPNSYVISVTNATDFVINNEATETLAGSTFTFTPPEFLSEDYMRVFTDSYEITDTACETTSASNLITVSASTDDLVARMTSVTGPGIPEGTFVTAVNLTTHVLTLNNQATITDTGVTLKFYPGWGVVSLPKSDILVFKASGRESTDGNEIFRVIGPHSVGSNDTGRIDSSVPITLLGTSSSTVESSGYYDYSGTIYYNSASKKLRIFHPSSEIGVPSVWLGVTDSNVIVSTRAMTAATGDVTYAHGLGKKPSSIDISSTYLDAGTGAFSTSTGHYDGTHNRCVYGGTANTGNSTGSSIFSYLDGSNFIFGYVSAVDATNITITWDKVGTPTGTVNLMFTSRA